MEPTKLNINMPTELRRKFKAICAENGDTMTDVLLDCARQYIRKHQVQPDRTADSRAPYVTKMPEADD